MPSNQPPLCHVARSALASWNSPFSYASHILPKTQEEAQEMSCRYTNLSPYQKKKKIINHSWSRWHKVPQVPVVGLCGCPWQWCASWSLSTVLVVSLGWPQPGSVRAPGLSDVITSFIGGHHSRLCTPPRSSHTLTAPFANRPSHSLLSTIIHRSQHRPQTHIKTLTHTQIHTCRPLLFVLYPWLPVQGSL